MERRRWKLKIEDEYGYVISVSAESNKPQKKFIQSANDERMVRILIPIFLRIALRFWYLRDIR